MTQRAAQTVVERILDANLNRAREGLRILEEWCRFGLEDEALTTECKDMRQILGRWHAPSFKAARDTAQDVGTAITHAQEVRRGDLSQLLQANLGRVQEALRSLEEYSKLSTGVVVAEGVATGVLASGDGEQMNAVMKQLRYRVYQLETRLMLETRLRGDRLQRLKAAPLYLVTNPDPNLLNIVEAALKGGLKLVQYRDKNTDDAVRYANALGLKQLCDRYGALFLVNDRVDLALAVGADGIHLGQQDVPIAVARALLGPNKIIGRSTTSPEEMAKALAEGADYIGVGPVYETPTKAGKAAAGHEYVRYAQTHATVPWYAIGGIDEGNLASVIAAGAPGAAVVRAIMAAADPTRATQALLALFADPR
jgi:thiamine-phosphate pyrophosphorylase